MKTNAKKITTTHLLFKCKMCNHENMPKEGMLEDGQEIRCFKCGTKNQLELK